MNWRPMQQTPAVLNKKTDVIPRGAVYVGRPSVWGNPFIIGRDGTRQDVIEKYHHWLSNNPTLMTRLSELRGKSLVCWCAPLPCHADILLTLANTQSRIEK